MLLLLAATLWWEFFGHNFFHGTRGWWVFGDFQLMIEGANATGIASLTHLYTPMATGSLAPPGFIYFLVLLDTIARDFNLTIPALVASHIRYGQMNIGLGGKGHYEYLYGNAAVLILPVVAVLSSLPVLALNELMSREQNRSVWRSRVGLLLAAALLFWMSAQWGHPDDAVSLGLLLLATTKFVDKKWGAAGWLLGLALAIQPLAALAIPVLLALLPLRRMPGFVLRIAILPLVVLIPQLVGDWRYAKMALTVQPDSGPFMTPLFRLASPARIPAFQQVSGLVASAPFRTVSSLAAALVGLGVFWCVRKGWQPRTEQILGLITLCLSFRMAVEPVMWPYYIVPALVMLCSLAGSVSTSRLIFLVLGVTAAAIGAGTHAKPWVYWLGYLLPLAIGLLAACPAADRPGSWNPAESPETRALLAT